MKIFEHSTANNPVLKIVFAILFITFPIIGFIFGIQYQSLVEKSEIATNTVTNLNLSIVPTQAPISSSPTQTINTFSETESWKTYTNTIYNYQLKYPLNWEVSMMSADLVKKPTEEEIARGRWIRIFDPSRQSRDCDICGLIDIQIFGLTPGKYDVLSKTDSNINGIKMERYEIKPDNQYKYRKIYYYSFPTKDKKEFFEISIVDNVSSPDLEIMEKILSTFKFNSATSWKTYTHNKFADLPDSKIYWKGFKLYYPSSWVLKEDRREAGTTNNYPLPYLSLVLSKTNGDFIGISQATGGGGYCLFPDQSEYTTFKGMATQYKNFKEIIKSNKIIWRLADWPVINSDWSHQLCEKFDSNMFKVGYMDSTVIGFFQIKVTTPESIAELNEILNKLEIID